jgi:hypothetical protein
VSFSRAVLPVPTGRNSPLPASGSSASGGIAIVSAALAAGSRAARLSTIGCATMESPRKV